MREDEASRIMRTPIDIADPILREVKDLQRREGKPLGLLISTLLARALNEPRSAVRISKPRAWICREMGARVDLNDTDAVYAAMDKPPAHANRRCEP